MSVSAASQEFAVEAPGLQAESLSSTKLAESEGAEVVAPRRGGRTRKPTAKAAGVDVTGTIEPPPSRAAKKRKVDDPNIDKEPVASATEVDADRINEEVDEVFDAANGQGKGDEEEDEKQYCICRGKDDGTFMISCERCQEWYHTKCIGITQKAAKKLEEYVCEACTNKEVDAKKATLSKPTKKYKSSKRRKASDAQTDEPVVDEPAEPEEEEVEDDASDGDEYVGERGDEASEAEDATMEDVSVPNASTRSTQRRTQPSASSSRTYQGIARAKVAPTDKQAPRRPSESTRRPSSSSTLTSSSKKTAARKPTGPSDASTEEARSRARKVLASALENIFSSSDAKQVQVEAKEDEENEVSLAEAFAALLEEELFETNADLHGSVRIVGSKYKDRFRTFLFSLKDAKNTTLHSRIASGELQASELAKMSNEELANDSIRQATEKARLDSLHRSTLRSEEAGPLRKITHKGEIEIESDALHDRDQPGKFQRSAQLPAARISESEPAVPTSHKSSSDDAAMEEGEQDSAQGGQSPPQDNLARRSAPAPGLADSPSRLNFGDVWTKDADAKDEDGDAEPGESYGFDVGSPHDEAFGHGIAEHTDTGATEGADDFIDSFLDGPVEEAIEPSVSAEHAPKGTTERSTTPEADPPSTAVHRYRTVIWNGLIDLPDVFAFQGHVKQVAGRSLTSTPRVWSRFLPERPLLIAGRLPSKAAIDYLLQVVNAPRTEILTFTMEPGASKDGVTQTTESDQASFDGMLKHFKNADRWGALHVSSSVKGSLIKDFYVVPLYKDEEVPLWLDMAESDCLGADWHTKRDRDLLVLVAVVFREALQSELSKAERSTFRQRSATNDDAAQRTPTDARISAEDAYDPMAGIALPLSTSAALPVAASAAPAAAFGSDALQSLLRTLGKTTAPPSSGSAVAANTGALSPFGAPAPGPPPPGPPPGPPPSFTNVPAPASAAAIGGSLSPYPGGGNEQQQQQWGPPQGYQPQPYGYPRGADPTAYGNGGEWSAEPAAPSQPQELPEEEYPGQYNPDFLAQASSGTQRGGGRGRGGWGGRGRGW